MTPLSISDISLDRDAFFIAGAWLPASAPTSTTEVLEAATGKVLGSAALAGTADVGAAVSAAAEALRGPWGATSGAQRAEVMRAMATSLQARAKDTAALVSRENGMPRRLSLGANGFFPSIALNYYAGLAEHIDDEDLRTGALSQVSVRREPVGVIAAVIPWNYPMSLAAMKIAPALAAGCSVVLKPPPETALDAFAWADAAIEAGLPAGVLNVIPGGREAGAAMVAHPRGRQGRLHRLDRRRTGDRRALRAAAKAGHAGAWRQVRGDRRRRRGTGCLCRRAARHLPAQ